MPHNNKTQFYVKPFNKEHERIFRHLMKNNIAYTNDIKISRSFGRHYPRLINEDWVDIARIEKKKRTLFASPPEIRIIPRRGKFFFYRID